MALFRKNELCKLNQIQYKHECKMAPRLKTVHVQTVKHKALETGREVFYCLPFFSGPSAVLTFVLRVGVLVHSRWWEVDAGRGTALGMMSIITY